MWDAPKAGPADHSPRVAPVSRKMAVVALGGNALLRRGEPLEAANQARAARAAARVLGRAALNHQLVITHGNGPQVGLLALMSDAYTDVEPSPLDVLGSETVGQIGYVLEMQLDNFIDHQDTVAVITRVVVDEDDPAFEAPTKFIGPVYGEAEARTAAERHGWTVRPDGDRWRRVVPSPEPRRIVQLGAIRSLVEASFLVVCAGGGGVPVLATELGVDKLVLATDVDAVYEGYGTSGQRVIARATPAGLRRGDFPAGSMGPKVEAVCRFVKRTGGIGVIGSLGQVPEMLEGRAGTRVRVSGPEIEYAKGGRS
jgi:carbamate kinase